MLVHMPSALATTLPSLPLCQVHSQYSSHPPIIPRSAPPSPPPPPAFSVNSMSSQAALCSTSSVSSTATCRTAPGRSIQPVAMHASISCAAAGGGGWGEGWVWVDAEDGGVRGAAVMQYTKALAMLSLVCGGCFVYVYYGGCLCIAKGLFAQAAHHPQHPRNPTNNPPHQHATPRVLPSHTVYPCQFAGPVAFSHTTPAPTPHHRSHHSSPNTAPHTLQVPQHAALLRWVLLMLALAVDSTTLAILLLRLLCVLRLPCSSPHLASLVPPCAPPWFSHHLPPPPHQHHQHHDMPPPTQSSRNLPGCSVPPVLLRPAVPIVLLVLQTECGTGGVDLRGVCSQHQTTMHQWWSGWLAAGRSMWCAGGRRGWEWACVCGEGTGRIWREVTTREVTTRMVGV